MLYVIPDALLKVLLNTNKTGQHVIRWAKQKYMSVYGYILQKKG